MNARQPAHDGSARPAGLVSTPTDVSDLLSLNSTPARVIVFLFIASNAVFALATLDRMSTPWPPFVALALISIGALLVTRPHPDPFPTLDTAVVIGIVVVTALVVSWSMPVTGSLGRESWHLGAATWLLFFLALRRRAPIAWLGILLLAGVTLWWALSTDHSPIFALNLVQTHMGILLVATLFASSLRRTAKTINTLTTRSIDAAAAAAAADAGREIRRQRVAELAALAVPPLDQIASGTPLTDDDRRHIQTIEAELRDSVRGRALSVPSIAKAARAARSRGVEVNLLDDRGAPLPSGNAMQKLIAIVVGSLEDMQQGTLTVRMLPMGRDVAVTVVSRDDAKRLRLSLNEDGEAQVDA